MSSDSANILIVDDNPNNLQVLGSILQEAGFRIRPALSGEIALRAADADLPDLILLDVRMPGMDGYETCQQLKADPAKRDVPVIFISALDETEDKLQAFRAGAVDYITKPFQAEEVLARVRTQMELASTRASLSRSNARLLALMDQLVQSEKLKSLGSLAAGIAHELNTPVGNAMLTAGSIEAIAHEYRDAQRSATAGPQIDELVATCVDGAALILRNLDRASKLITSLKEIAVDRDSERCRQISLRQTIGDFVAAMGGIMHRTPYSIAIDIDPLLLIDTYPGHLEHILENLIQNAIVHGYDGAASGTITISAKRTADGGASVSVADQGKGIAAEHLQRVFDPFFTTRLGQGGSGLGLHLVYNLATAALGGAITVDSKPGAGTVFTLTLPAIPPRHSPAAPVAR